MATLEELTKAKPQDQLQTGDVVTTTPKSNIPDIGTMKPKPQMGPLGALGGGEFLGSSGQPISTETLQDDVPSLSASITKPNPVPVSSVAGLDSTPPVPPVAPQPQPEPSEIDKRIQDLTLTDEEKQAQANIERQQQINQQLQGQSSFRAEQENLQGIPELLKTQNALSSQLKALQNEALAIPLQLQQEAAGRGITAGGLAPLQTARLRTNAIAALGVSSMLEASRGNIALAQDLADRAVEQKYGPIKEEIATLQANLSLIQNSPAYDIGIKNRAMKQMEAQEARKRAIEKEEANEREVRAMATSAVKFGLTDPETIRAINQASTPEEALEMAAPFLQDPQAKLQLESLRLGNIYKQQQINRFAEETEAKRQERLTKLAETGSDKGNLQEKVDTLRTILDHPGLDSRVGTTQAGRKTFALKDKITGQGEDFAATVKVLTGKDVLDNLIAVKARGATFGALSNQELGLLIDSASKIAQWEKRDENDKGIGEWNISEKLFKSEVNTLIDKYTRAMGDADAKTYVSSTETEAVNNFLNDKTIANASTPLDNYYD